MQNNIKTTRIAKTYKMELCADARTIFPLLCPVREIDWIDGWDEISNMIYTDSGIAEEGCVFETNKPTEGKAIWICSKYNLENTEIEYIKHVINKAIIKWAMVVKDVSENNSSIFVTYMATSLSDVGNDFIIELMEIIFPIFMQGLEEGINYYLSTGEKKLHNLETFQK